MRDPRSLARGVRRRVQDARLLRQTALAMLPPAPHTFARFGAGSVIAPPARVEGQQFIEIGDGCVLHEHIWLMARRREAQAPPRLVLHDGVRANRFVKIVCLQEVEVGPGTLFSDRVYVSDVEYVPGATDVAPGDRELTEPRPVRIGRGVFLGIGSVIKPGVTIGDLAYVAAGAVVSIDVPERTLVAGSPARAVKRWDPE